MKKVIYVIVALFLAMFPIFGVLISKLEADAPSYSHQMKITVTDTSGSNRTNVVAVLTLGGSTLFTSGFINSDGTDTDMENNGTEFNYMMADAEIPVYIGNLGNDASQVINLDMGYSPLKTNFPIILGSGGELVTPYSTSLELSDKWEIDINSVDSPAYINTDDIAPILYKDGEVSIAVTATGELTATVYDGSGARTVVLTGVNSGESYIVLALNAGTLTFRVGSHVGTTTVGTVVNNTNTWLWDTDGNVLPYISSIIMQNAASVTTSFVYVDKQSGGTDIIHKLDATDLSDTGLSWTFPTGYTAYPHSMCVDDTNIYILGQSSTNDEVFRINEDTMATTANLFYSACQMNQPFPGQGTVMVEDSGNLYLIEPYSGSPSTYAVDRINTLSMLVTGGGSIGNQAIAVSGGYLYGIGITGLSGLTKYSESDLSTLVHGTGISGTSCDLAVAGNIVYVRRTVTGGGTIYTYNATTFASYGLWSSGYSIYDDNIALTTAGTDLLQINNTGSISGNPTIKNWYYNDDTTPSVSSTTWTAPFAGTDYAVCGDGVNYNYTADSNSVYVLDRNAMSTLESTTLAGTSYNIGEVTTTSSGTLTEVLKYRPTTMIIGTTLPNLDDESGGTDGNLEFGTNPDMTIEYGVVTSTITGIPTGLNATIASDTSHRWLIPGFSEVLVNTQSTLKKLPFWDIFAPVASDTDPTHPNGGGINTNPNGGITLYGLYLLMGGAVVLAIGAWVAMLTGSRIVLLISLVIMMSIFVAPLFSAWMVIVLIVGGISILYLVRQG